MRTIPIRFGHEEAQKAQERRAPRFRTLRTLACAFCASLRPTGFESLCPRSGLWRTLPLVGGLCAVLVVGSVHAADNVTESAVTYSSTTTITADNSITSSGATTVNNGANVTYDANARVTLGAGFKVNAGGLFRVKIGQRLPYVAGFESGESFSTGSIASQRGWLLSQGSASITSSTGTSSSRGLEVSGSTSSPGLASQFLQASGSPSIIFLEIYAKPVAEISVAASTRVQTEAAVVAFQISGGRGEIVVFDGYGANQWIPTGIKFDLDGSQRADDWVRLNFRINYSNKSWDLWVGSYDIDDNDGESTVDSSAPAEYDVAFLDNNEGFLRLLRLTGTSGSSATSYFDSITASETNPLFTDTDKDGLPDDWEDRHFENLDQDRIGNPDGDLLNNIEELYYRQSPKNDYDSDDIPDEIEDILGTDDQSANSNASSTGLKILAPTP